jgi:hypothetical protein
MFALPLLAAGAVGPTGVASDGRLIRTIAVVPGHIDGFAQNEKYLALAWRCFHLRITDRGSGAVTSIYDDLGCTDVTRPSGFVVAGSRAYWVVPDHSLSTESSILLSASLRDHKVRPLDGQSILNSDSGGVDVLVPPASDGRSAYYWTSVMDATPGPLIRFDDRHRTKVADAVPGVSALAAGGGRYGFAAVVRGFDCAQSPSWSPDGQWIVYASLGEDGCKGGLWRVHPDGSGERRLVDKGLHPDWSPDGSTIAYDDGAGAIALVPANGGDSRTVIHDGSDPAWAPDGKQLAFVRKDAIYVASVDGSNERLLDASGVAPDWAPDGTRLVFARPPTPKGRLRRRFRKRRRHR